MKINPYSQMNGVDLIGRVNQLVSVECLNKVMVHAVFTKDEKESWKYLIGKLVVSDPQDDKEEIYSEFAFVRKALLDFDLMAFMKSLEGDGFRLSSNFPLFIKTGKTNINWSEAIVPSHATVSGYPARNFSAKLVDADFNESVLLGFDMPFYSSAAEYVKSFMRLSKYHGHSDARNGELSIEIFDYRGRISFANGQVSIESDDLDICLVGKAHERDTIILRPGDTFKVNERSLSESELWLLTKENEVLDFLSQKEWQYRIEYLDEESKKSEQYQALIDCGEGHETEFKSYIEVAKNKNSKAEELEKTVCALSNTKGGYLFIGVNDDGSIDGVDEKVKCNYKIALEEAVGTYIKDIGKRLRESLKDGRCFDISSAKIGTKQIVVVSIERSEKLNYYVNSRQAFIRRGATSFKMLSTEERED